MKDLDNQALAVEVEHDLNYLAMSFLIIRSTRTYQLNIAIITTHKKKKAGT